VKARESMVSIFNFLCKNLAKNGQNINL